LRDGDQVGAGTALNDVVVNSQRLRALSNIDCWVGAHYVTGFRADGLIHSDANRLDRIQPLRGRAHHSARTDAISICPICPHTLTNRPLVLPFTAEIRLQMNTREQEVMFTADDRQVMPLMATDKVVVRKSEKTFNTVCAKDRDYLRSCEANEVERQVAIREE